MSQRLNNLNDLIAILKAGADYYRRAARQTERPEAEKIFQDHADERERMAQEISVLVDRAGHDPAGAAPSEQARSVLAQIGSLFDDRELVLAKGLEKHDTRTVEAFRSVIQHPDNQVDAEMLSRFLSEIEASQARTREVRESV